MSISEDHFLKLVLALRNALAEAVEQLNTLIEELKPAPVRLEEASEYFPEGVRSLLIFEEAADAIIVKPRTYLGSENFSKILSIVKEHNGEYVSLGRNSHFRLPKTT